MQIATRRSNSESFFSENWLSAVKIIGKCGETNPLISDKIFPSDATVIILSVSESAFVIPAMIDSIVQLRWPSA